MLFIANENFPGPSIDYLRSQGINIKSIAEEIPGASDERVMKIAISEKRVILTHDSDYGELIFKFGFKPEAGIVYFRVYDFEPQDPAKLLSTLIKSGMEFRQTLTVVDNNSIRQRSY